MSGDGITLGPVQFSMYPLELVSIRMAVCPMGMLRGTWDFTLKPKASPSCLILCSLPYTRWSWCARGWRYATWLTYRGIWDFFLETKASLSCLTLCSSPYTRWSWCAHGWRCAPWGPTGAFGTAGGRSCARRAGPAFTAASRPPW